MLTSFSTLMHRRMKDRTLDLSVIGTIAMQELYIQTHTTQENLSGHIRHHILYLHTIDPQRKIHIYTHKKSLLTQINDKIHNVGFGYSVKDIRLV